MESTKRTNRIGVHAVLAALFVAVLWLPIWQWKWQRIQEQALAGEEKAIEVVPLTLANWFDASFQRSFEARQARKLSFRGHLVRSNNQLNLDVFGDLVPKVLKGTDDELFEASYHPRAAWFTADVMAIRERLRKLAKLQDYLAERRVALLVMITPSKVQHDAEFLPADLRRIVDRTAPTEYSVVHPILLQNRISLLDFKQYFEQRRSASPVRFFPKGGQHWNYYAGAMAANELLDKVAELTGTESKRPEIVGHVMSTPKYWADWDVAVLTNVWNWKRFVGEVPYPVFSKPAVEAEAGPRILFVGGSFIFQVSDTLAEQRLCSKIDVLFYDNKWIRYQGAKRGPKQAIDKSRRNLAALLLRYDAVVIESNEVLLSQLGYGFIEDACQSVGLEARPKPGR